MIDLAQRLANLSPDKRELLEDRLRRTARINEPIALVGMACRFPGASGLAEYWRLIHEGLDATGEIPSTRWDVDAFYDASGEQTGKMSVRWAGLVEGIEHFDPQFFGISPREAARMDPQQRLLLEVAWEAFEHACIPVDRLAGTATGVFIGIGGTDYSKLPAQFEDYFHHIDAHVGTGNALSIAANRLSYIFDLRGPSLAVDTACSSSTMGLHLAIQSLRNRDCDVALAGGVNAILTPETTIAFSKARMLSPDGRCRPFDAEANGYVRGEGCGLIVLKRLIDATRDGDRVLAVVRACATNQDGRTSGITAPNGLAQRTTIQSALSQSGLQAAQISYVEAHGTGTPLGDPIEIQALGEVFSDPSGPHRPCYVTSVKANVGHLETVSGVAGIIKVVLMMQRGLIPRQLYFERLNPRISLDGTRLVIPSQTVPWTSGDEPLRAGVSSFGFGGTNTHVILESVSAATPVPGRAERPLHILPLSGRSEEAVRDLASRYADFLESGDVPLADVAHTAGAGRAQLSVRAAVVGDEPAEVVNELRKLASDSGPSTWIQGPGRSSKTPRIAFLFTGQGAQYADMGRVLYDTHSEFRQTLEQCQDILREELDVPLLEVLFPPPEEALADRPTGTRALIHRTCYTQPALFALEYGLARLWQAWGVEPDLLLGHSVGEYVAACIAGVFSLEDGLRLIARRARLMQQLPEHGAMAVVFAPPDVIDRAVAGRDDVTVAAYNGPENTVISGAATAVHELVKTLAAEGVGAKALQVSHAFHSPLMEPILGSFEQYAESVEFRPPALPVVSNLTGELLERAGAHYFRDHIREPVQFAAGMQCLADQEVDILLEVGPSTSLLGMGRRCLADGQRLWLPSLRKGQPDWQVLLASLAGLYVQGASIRWDEFDRPWRRHWVSLPSYPFQRQRCWLEPESPLRRMMAAAAPSSQHPLLGSRLATAMPASLYQAEISGRNPGYLRDHQVQQSVVFPAAGYLELGFAAAHAVYGDSLVRLRNVAIQQAMFLLDGESRVIETSVTKSGVGAYVWETHSHPATPREGEWVLHAGGHCERLEGDPQPPAAIDVSAVRERLTRRHSGQEFYEELMADRQLRYGNAFRVLQQLQRSADEAFAVVELPEAVRQELAGYDLHPALGDALFQTAAGLVPLQEDGSYSPYTYLPVAVREVCRHGPLSEPMFTYARRTSPGDSPNPELVEGDLFLVDRAGHVLVTFAGLQMRRVSARAVANDVGESNLLYRVEWQPCNAPSRTTGSNGRPAVDGAWIVLADEAGVGDEVARKLHHCGAQVLVVRPEGRLVPRNPAEGMSLIEIDPLDAAQYDDLVDAVKHRLELPVRGVLHLWSLNVASEGSEPGSLQEIRPCGVGGLLRLIRSMTRAAAPPLSLTIVTQGAQLVSGKEGTFAPLQGALWGMGRVAAVEHPELGCRLLDVDPDADHDAAAAAVVATAESSTSEDQLAYRGGQWYVPRLRVLDDSVGAGIEAIGPSGQALPPRGPFRLRLKNAGSFDSLTYEPATRALPEAGQVEVRVAAAGLNFSDVLKAMGLYPGITDAIVPLGIECSGVVTAIGRGVRRFRVGDAVMGIAPFSFASHARTAEYCLVPRPAALTDSDAVSIPITFLTAYHGLVRLAQLQPQERVLIHAAAGGVGLAALQIARHVGATVFATAGSETKRDYLRALGVSHVMDSRTLEFADEIRRVTDGEGVDVVLNSLPGEAIAASLGLLRAYGRFLEIGKSDIYQNRMLGLEPFQDNLSYFAIDLDRILRQRPEYIQALFAEIMHLVEQKIYEPLPVTLFDAEETVEAFRFMATRKNIGKVVVTLDGDPARDEVSAPATGQVATPGTVLITGGLGALGLRVARWFAERGTSHVALLSRGRPSSEASEVIDQLRKRGCNACVLQGDVADRNSLESALANVPAEFPPLAGVVHAAGVLADGLLHEMSDAQLELPLRAKLEGTWNLHRATCDQPLRFFVTFSSVAALLGSPGQANYAAANAFLDSFAVWRRQQGLPAASINWGPWAEAGMAARAGRETKLAAHGMQMLSPESCLSILEDLLSREVAQAAVIDADWETLRRSYGGGVPRLLDDIAASSASRPSTDAVEIDQTFLAQLGEATEDRQIVLLSEYFADELVRIMGLERGQLDCSQPLNELGLDSLLAMELKNNLERRLDFSLPMSAFMDAPSIETLAAYSATALGGGATMQRDGHALDSRGANWTPLATLYEGSTAANVLSPAPLFCLHPLGGDIGCYRDLAARFADEPCLKDRALIALRGRGSDGMLDPHQALDEMINAYAEAVRTALPSGPCYLAGWSAGGIYAYELARTLQGGQTDVRALFLFDTPRPSIYDDVDLQDHARFLADFIEFANMFLNSDMQVDYEQLRGLSEREAFDCVLQEARARQVIGEHAAVDSIRKLVEVGKTHVRMIKEYQVEPLALPVHLFLPVQKGRLEQASGQRLESDLGWSLVLGDHLRLHSNSGDHFSMMLGSNATELAAQLGDLLAEPESSKPGPRAVAK